MFDQADSTTNARSATTDHPVNGLLSRRFSPYRFDATRDVSTSDLRSIFEAARWTMSSYNAQPWRYIVGVRERDADSWQKVFGVLVEGNKPWAQNAPVLALGIVEHRFEHNGKDNKAAAHDLGAASANLTVEATARGLVVHQMIGIDPEKAREVFDLPESMEALTALAIGYAGGASELDPQYSARDEKPRVRKPLADLLLAGNL